MINQHYNELNVTTFGQQLSIVTGIDASVYTNRPIAKRLWINMDFVLNYQIKTCQFVYNILLGALHVYPNRAITFIHKSKLFFLRTVTGYCDLIRVKSMFEFISFRKQVIPFCSETS